MTFFDQPKYHSLSIIWRFTPRKGLRSKCQYHSIVKFRQFPYPFGSSTKKLVLKTPHIGKNWKSHAYVRFAFWKRYWTLYTSIKTRACLCEAGVTSIQRTNLFIQCIEKSRGDCGCVALSKLPATPIQWTRSTHRITSYPRKGDLYEPNQLLTKNKPASCHWFWKDNASGINSLENTFQVHPSCDFSDKNRSHSFLSQFLMHAKKVYFDDFLFSEK